MSPIKFANQKWPWRVVIPARYTETGKRKTEYFHTRAEAESRIAAIKLDGRAAVTGKRPEPTPQHIRQILEHAAAELGNDPAKILDAIRAYKTHHAVKQATVRQAVELYLEWRKGRVSSSTHDADRWRLLRLVYAHSAIPLSVITTQDIEQFLDRCGKNSRSIYKSLSPLFKWAKRYGYLASNPVLDVHPPDTGFGQNNDIYPVNTFARMLNIATQKYPPLLPVFVLGGLCGLRACESYRLTRNSDAIQWNDLQNKYIHIRESVAKSTRRLSDTRYITDNRALEALSAWLPLFPKHDAPFIVQYSKRKINEFKRAFRKETGIKLIKNGLRNSYCSYSLSLPGVTLESLAKQAGNSPAVLRRHYVEVLPPESGADWFSLRP